MRRPRQKPKTLKPRVNGVTFGICTVSPFTAERETLYKAAAAMGFSVVRAGCSWQTVQPEKDGAWDWEATDKEVALIRKYGMNVYLNAGGAPRWAAEGKLTYESVEQLMDDSPGCTEWSHDERIIKFAEERDYCGANPAHIDPQAMRTFAEKLARRYAGQVQWWGVWNEPGFPIFYPPAFKGEWYGQFTSEIVAPFTEGARSVLPKAKLVGPEAEDWGTLDRLLKAEKESGERWYDVISFHPYAWAGPFPQDSYRRMDEEFMKVAEEYRGDREVWVSEINGGDAKTKVEYMREMSRRKITTLIWLQPEDFFEADRKTPNELGRGVEALFAETRRRRVVTV